MRGGPDLRPPGRHLCVHQWPEGGFALGQVRRQGFWLPGKEGVVQRLETQTEGLLSSQFLPLAPWATHLGKSGQPALHPHASFPVFLK